MNISTDLLQELESNNGTSVLYTGATTAKLEAINPTAEQIKRIRGKEVKPNYKVEMNGVKKSKLVFLFSYKGLEGETKYVNHDIIISNEIEERNGYITLLNSNGKKKRVLKPDNFNELQKAKNLVSLLDKPEYFDAPYVWAAREGEEKLYYLLASLSNVNFYELFLKNKDLTKDKQFSFVIGSDPVTEWTKLVNGNVSQLEKEVKAVGTGECGIILYTKNDKYTTVFNVYKKNKKFGSIFKNVWNPVTKEKDVDIELPFEMPIDKSATYSFVAGLGAYEALMLADYDKYGLTTLEFKAEGNTPKEPQLSEEEPSSTDDLPF